MQFDDAFATYSCECRHQQCIFILDPLSFLCCCCFFIFIIFIIIVVTIPATWKGAIR